MALIALSLIVQIHCTETKIGCGMSAPTGQTGSPEPVLRSVRLIADPKGACCDVGVYAVVPHWLDRTARGPSRRFLGIEASGSRLAHDLKHLRQIGAEQIAAFLQLRHVHRSGESPLSCCLYLPSQGWSRFTER